MQRVEARKEEIAWAAGLFEGEGTVYLRPQKENCSAWARSSLSMSDIEPVAQFHEIVGFGNFGGPYGPYRKYTNEKVSYRWTCNIWEEIIILFKSFEPWLSPRRIEQFNNVLNNIPNNLPLQRGGRKEVGVEY